MDRLPEMYALYTDIKSELVDLVSDNSLLLMLNNVLEYQVREISEQYLISTDEIPLEDVKIAQVDDRYCVISNDNEFFFEIYISPESNLTNMDKISSKAVSITETDSKIPVINSKDLEEDFER